MLQVYDTDAFERFLVQGGIMTKKLGSIKRILGALAIGGALLFGIGAGGVSSVQAAQRRAVIVVGQNNRWERDRWERQNRREWRERDRWRFEHHRRWRDRWGVWHWN